MENVIEWKNFELLIRNFEHSHANGGRLNKLWVEDRLTGRVFLIKGSSKSNYEPFSEKLAYIVGKNLGIDVLEYDIIPSEYFSGILGKGCGYVSICEKIDRSGYSITSVAEIKRARNTVLGFSGKKITNKEVMYEILPKNYIDTMFLFDAIIGNSDRHYGNVHVLRDVEGKFIGAPILDNGASLLANVSILAAIVSGDKVGEMFNTALTTDRNHDKQIASIGTLNNISFNIPVVTMNILKEIEPILEIMPNYRAKLIEKYLVYRIRKYLGIIKYGVNKPIRKLNTMTEAEQSIYR